MSREKTRQKNAPQKNRRRVFDFSRFCVFVFFQKTQKLKNQKTRLFGTNPACLAFLQSQAGWYSERTFWTPLNFYGFSWVFSGFFFSQDFVKGTRPQFRREVGLMAGVGACWVPFHTFPHFWCFFFVLFLRDAAAIWSVWQEQCRAALASTCLNKSDCFFVSCSSSRSQTQLVVAGRKSRRGSLVAWLVGFSGFFHHVGRAWLVRACPAPRAKVSMFCVFRFLASLFRFLRFFVGFRAPGGR
jgi:hypothetical protein